MEIPLEDIASFLADYEDWYSCYGGDEEALQDMLEQGSVASFYTALGSLSNGGFGASMALSTDEPNDLDQSLGWIVPETEDDSQPSHRHPEVDEGEAPAHKRTRNVMAESLPLSPVAAKATNVLPRTKPSTRDSRRSHVLRARSLPTIEGVSGLLRSGASFSGPIRVAITVQPDGTSVKLRIMPAIFRFGNVPFPITRASADIAAMLRGSDCSLPQQSRKLGASQDQEQCQGIMARSSAPKEPQQAEAECDAYVHVEARRCASGGDDSVDPLTTKDQTRSKRQAVDKDLKSSFTFPNALLHCVFSSLRASSNESGLRPATVQELGSELLRSSTADLSLFRRSIPAALHNAVVVAGYVQAAAPPHGSEAPTETHMSVSGETTAAVHQLASTIFSNVLRASGGGAEAAEELSGARDISSPAKHQHATQRDKVAAAQLSQPAGAPTEETPRDGELPPGQAAKADANAENSPLFQGISAEVSEYSGLPTPALEHCDSPVTIGAVGLEEVEGSATDDDEVSGPASQGAGTAAAKLAAETSAVGTATASPRTMSKKAYGTVAQLVKKMVPNFRDSAVMSMMATDSPRDEQAPVADTEASVQIAARSVEEAEPCPTAEQPVVEQASADPSCGEEEAVGATDEGQGVEQLPDTYEQETKCVAAPTAAAQVPDGLTPSQPGDCGTALPAAQQEEHTDSKQADETPSPPGDQFAPGMFIFGQEQPKPAKHPIIKPRPVSAKAAAVATASDPVAAVDVGRKRKADAEVLPCAKMATPNDKADAETTQPQAETAPETAVASTPEAALVPASQAPLDQPQEPNCTANDEAPHEEAPEATAVEARSVDPALVTEEVAAMSSTTDGTAATEAAEPVKVKDVEIVVTEEQEPPLETVTMPPASGKDKKKLGLFRFCGCFRA
ncbi:hypothetical protein Agub_g10625 [Astrephomene gubernaculifera]|uniref:Uncharacterized protein n=1 Tax=Astrephomene gubernaculifera TaxID=47775 RepID=A0AAD3DV68_9CHLO|nr:hypothetical protein Agub_g10625 [Astrephomene gubernaculifera]